MAPSAYTCNDSMVSRVSATMVVSFLGRPGFRFGLSGIVSWAARRGGGRNDGPKCGVPRYRQHNYIIPHDEWNVKP